MLQRNYLTIKQRMLTFLILLFKRIALQFFTDYLSHHLLYIEESHGVVVINLRNGVVHIINGIAYPFNGFFKVFHIDSRIGFLETVEKEGYHFGMLRQVLVKGLTDLGLAFVIELTNVFKHRHSAGIGLYRRDLLPHLLAYFLCLRNRIIVNVLKLFREHREDSL